MSSRNKIQIGNPDLHESPTTGLSQDVAATSWTTLNVYSTSGFSAISTAPTYYYLLIGTYWSETSEIVLASSKTDTTFIISAPKYSHSASDAVTYIPYNKVKFYGRPTSGWPSNFLAIVDIDCTQQSTTYEYTPDINPYLFFVSTYYRSDTTADESGASDEISLTSFTANSTKKIIESGVRKAMTKVDENPDGILGWNILLDIVNEWLGEILTRKKQWQCLHKVDSSISTVANTEYISKPTDLSVLEFLYVDGRKIDYITKLRYNQYVTGNFVQATGKPVNYTIKNDKVYLYPKPDGVYTTSFEYYSVPDVVTSLSQEIRKEFSNILVYFVAAQAAYIRNNEKRGTLMEVKYNRVLENQIEDVTGQEQVWESATADVHDIWSELDE